MKIEEFGSKIDTVLEKTGEVLEKNKALENTVKEQNEKIKKMEEAHTGMINQPVVGTRSDSVEQKALQYFGKRSAQDLLHINTEAPENQWIPQEVRRYVKNFKSELMNARMIAQVFHGGKLDTGSDVKDSDVPVRGILDSYYGKNVLSGRIKAFGSTIGGAGDEWAPTALASQYIDEYELDRRIEAAFRSINMPTNPYELPRLKDVTEARLIAENTGMTDVNFGTAKVTYSAKKLGEYYILPEELNEDSAPDVFALARMELVEAQQRAVEQAIINGDDSGTHMDADTDGGAADLAAKAWKGLRRLAIDASNTVTFGTQVSKAKLTEMQAAADKFGINPRELAWVFSARGYHQAKNNLEDMQTVDKVGSAALAINLSGVLASYQGIPVIVSEFVRNDLNASGVEDGVTQDNTVVHLVNHRRFTIGRRRGIRLKVMMDLPDQDRWKMASYQRLDFQPTNAAEAASILGVDVTI